MSHDITLNPEEQRDSIRTLHVDDDPDFTELTAQFVKREDETFDIETASSGQEALASLSEHDFDCVISDYNMPGMDGIEFLKAVREDYPDLPFILFTGRGSEEIASDAISAGVTEYLQKSGGTDQYELLVQKIQNVVDSRDVKTELRYKSNLLDQIFEQFPMHVYLKDTEAQYLRTSTDGDLDRAGKTVIDVFGDVEFARKAHVDDLRVMDTEEPIKGEEERFVIEGDDVWNLTSKFPIYDQNDEVMGLMGVTQQITEQKERERELSEKTNLLEQLFDQIPAVLYVKDHDGNLLWNSVDVTDEEQSTETGDSAAPDLFTDRGEERHEDDMRVIESGEPILEKEEKAPDSGKWFQTSKVPWYGKDGEIKGLFGITKDITEQKVYEQELERQITRLEEFTSIVSHDLRNPLNIAQGYLELTKEDCESEHLAEMENAIERCFELIENLLTLSRHGETVRDTEPVDLDTVVRSAWGNVDTGDATVVCEADMTIYTDTSRLEALFENLFRNAVVHVGDHVTVTIGAHGDGFFVEDDGHGISPEEREKVLERGYTDSAEGKGYGLYIVSEIAAGHGWSLDIAESESGGARFEFSDIQTVSSES